MRWFPPGGEINLCGHATLATAYVVMNFIETGCNTTFFQTKSGILIVRKKQDLYEMELPTYQIVPVPVTSEMKQAIGFRPV